MAGTLDLHEDLIADIASRLDLREPNQEAVQTLAAEVSQYFDVDGKPPPFEAVLDAATGVGKTYILTGAMEYFATAHAVRDFVVVTPGRTILRKTQDNFTPGHAKSLLGPMSFTPAVITSDNFATPATRVAMGDDTQVKLYVFTVQALLKPESKVGRRTHKFQEGLGAEFYAHLQSLPHLVVFADEHHTYYGPAFSKAVRELNPWVLVGLTATPRVIGNVRCQASAGRAGSRRHRVQRSSDEARPSSSMIGVAAVGLRLGQRAGFGTR